MQARGYRDAMPYVESMLEVDAGDIVLWDDSYSAAQEIVVGAVDARPAAVIAGFRRRRPQLTPPQRSCLVRLRSCCGCKMRQYGAGC